ncbi:pentapeptide repeat-containing protein [Intrasporangium sp.]|uniref:pentapeptide repeat-containing protein n=1 Tax=Intrasporangium sp. TaxID=1925024 RepID=UPI0039C8A240
MAEPANDTPAATDPGAPPGRPKAPRSSGSLSSGAGLSRSPFWGSVPSACVFSGCVLPNCVLSGCVLSGCVFSGSLLSACDSWGWSSRRPDRSTRWPSSSVRTSGSSRSASRSMDSRSRTASSASVRCFSAWRSSRAASAAFSSASARASWAISVVTDARSSAFWISGSRSSTRDRSAAASARC